MEALALVHVLEVVHRAAADRERIVDDVPGDTVGSLQCEQRAEWGRQGKGGRK
jgi:hypothetical protein